MEAPVQQRYSFGPFVRDPFEKRLLRDYLHAIPEEQRRAVENVERLVRKWTQAQAPDADGINKSELKIQEEVGRDGQI